MAKRKGRRSRFQRPSSYLAPQVGLEPTTLRLTAECSAIELLRNKRPHIVSTNYAQGAKRFYSRWVFERQPQPPQQTCARKRSGRISPALIPRHERSPNGTPHNSL